MATQTILEAASPDDIPRVLQQVLDGVAKQLNEADYSKPLKEQVVPLLAEEHEAYFNAETGPLGKWPPLSPRTVRKKGFDTILIENNNLRSGLLFDGPEHVEDIGDRHLTWGTSDERAAIHQHGGGRIPQRAFVGVRESTVDKTSEIIADAAVAATKQ